MADFERPNPPVNALLRKLAHISVVVYLTVAAVINLQIQRAGFATLLEVGYGDSYVLYDILNVEKTGTIYRNLAYPPYLAAQYSPSIYLSYSLSRYFHFSNVFLGPRIIAFAFFLACLALVVSLVKKLVPISSSWIWALLLVASIGRMDEWILQIRGDFLGIVFALASIRLLMSSYRYAALTAGLCAGMAIQVKLTLVAAAVSGFLWLLMRRRWKETAFFTIGTLVTSVGLLWAYWLREPDMVRQMTVLLPGIRDFHGCIRLLVIALTETVSILSIAALPSFFRRIWPPALQWPNWTLLLLYVIAATGFGFLADIQAGGNINYFFEALLASIPFAVLGVFRVFSFCNRHPRFALLVPCFLLLHAFLLDRKAVSRVQGDLNWSLVSENNRHFRSLEKALRTRRILSIDPRIALIDAHPPLMEPYLLTYLRRQGRFNATSLIRQIDNAEFDVFVWLPKAQRLYRGVRKFDGADLENAVSAAYQPYCQILGDTIGLPRSHPTSERLKEDLRKAGCFPVVAANPSL